MSTDFSSSDLPPEFRGPDAIEKSLAQLEQNMDQLRANQIAIQARIAGRIVDMELLGEAAQETVAAMEETNRRAKALLATIEGQLAENSTITGTPGA